MGVLFRIGVDDAVLCLLSGGCDATDSSTPSTDASPSATNTTTSTAKPMASGWISLPPAPLGGRVAAGVVWTGTEMIVVEGNERSGKIGGPSPDGAAYNPATRTWRTLSAPPTGRWAG